MLYWWTFGLFLKPYVFSADNEVLENSWLLHLDRSYLYSEWTTAISLSVFCFEIYFVSNVATFAFSVCLVFFFIFKLSMTFNFWYDSYRPVDFMVFNFIFIPSHLLYLLIRLGLILYLLYIFSSSCFLISFHAVC